MRCQFVAVILFLSLFSVTLYAEDKTEILVIRSEHKLLVKKSGQTLRTFKVAFGSGGKKAKQRRGDYATPKGVYSISRIRSSERFHLFLQLNYPNMTDAKRALTNDLISRKQYRAILLAHAYNELPPQNTKLGGAIGIHGIGNETKDKIEIHQIADWTQGCIAMRNHEVEELTRYIDIGTKVEIID